MKLWDTLYISVTRLEDLQKYCKLVILMHTSATIPTSLASTETESYRVAAYDCINDDGTPNPNAAGDCTSSIFTVATQVTVWIKLM